MTEKSLNMNSDQGDAFQISLGATTEQRIKATSQEIQTCVIWTPDATCYVNLYSDSDASKFLLPANVLFPVPVDDLNDISIYNSAGTAITIYVMWRGR